MAQGHDRSRSSAGDILAIALALAALLGTAGLLHQVWLGIDHRVVLPWVPALGVEFAFKLDGLSRLFGLLVLGIGAVVLLYAKSYFRGAAMVDRTIILLGLFMLAMLGLILADDLITLFVFWELTTVFSFLLIGYAHHEAKARRAALMGLLVTSAGGLALLGMLAMQALRNRGDGGGGSARPAATGFTGLQEDAAADPELPPEQTVSDRTAALVLRAMIDAAKADGRVDATERQRILAKAQENGADPEAATFLQRAFERPADPDALAAEAAGDPVIAAQVYAASLLAIEVDTADERDYLRDLAQKLRLAPGVAAQLHSALGAPPP